MSENLEGCLVVNRRGDRGRDFAYPCVICTADLLLAEMQVKLLMVIQLPGLCKRKIGTYSVELKFRFFYYMTGVSLPRVFTCFRVLPRCVVFRSSSFTKILDHSFR